MGQISRLIALGLETQRQQRDLPSLGWWDAEHAMQEHVGWPWNPLMLEAETMLNLVF